jgi:aminopeptidase
MTNLNYNKLAELVVNYSVNVKEGDRVLLEGPTLAKGLLQALYVQILKSGGHPLVNLELEGSRELFFKYASTAQLEYVDEVRQKMIEDFDCFVKIDADYNPKKFSLINPKIITKFRAAPARRRLNTTYINRIATGALRWVYVPFPCHSYAQEASMDLFSYTEFVKETLFLDRENPIGEWQTLEKQQEKIVQSLVNCESLQILGEDTNLELNTKGRIWKNSCGHENLPDGEIFTSPLDDSVNGQIRFSYPGIYSGKEIENIFLKFKDGKVIEADADKGNELLQEVLTIENADVLGEFAFGTNYGITRFTKNIGFDEKMGGTIHCALGLAFPECGGKNESAIHWDLLKDMKPSGSKVVADGKVIYEEGKFLI